MIHVVSVTPTDGYGLILEFDTGEQRRFHMRPYLGYPVFKRLADPRIFALARIEYGTVVWPGEIDIAPETLYDRSEPLHGPAIESKLGSAPRPATGKPPDSIFSAGVRRKMLLSPTAATNHLAPDSTPRGVAPQDLVELDLEAHW